MAKDSFVAGIDVGSSKVSVVVADTEREGRPRLVGVGVAPSRGIRRGAVVNVEEAVESISAAVAKAERLWGHKIESAYATLTGGHIAAQTNHGVVGVSHSDRTISQDDVRRALESARVISLPADRQILHVLPRSFVVDGQDGVRNPVGMMGYRLDVEAHIVTGGVTAIQNLTQCLRRAGVEVEGFVLESLASAESVLGDEEKDMGVALVDIGGGTSNIAIFNDGSVCHTSVLGLGGGHVTNDIAVGLRTPLGSAEELKLEHGQVLLVTSGDDELVQAKTFGGEGEEVSKRQLCDIMEARLEEICTLVGSEIERAGYGGLLPAGIVLTGGTAETPGIEDLARAVLRTPVRVGRPRGVMGLSEMVRGPAYAAVAGLLLLGAGGGIDAYAGGGARTGRSTTRADEPGARDGGLFDRVVAWLRSFLP